MCTPFLFCNTFLNIVVGHRLVLDHSLARNQRYLGRTEHVLVEGLNPKQKGQVKISHTYPKSCRGPWIASWGDKFEKRNWCVESLV